MIPNKHTHIEKTLRKGNSKGKFQNCIYIYILSFVYDSSFLSPFIILIVQSTKVYNIHKHAPKSIISINNSNAFCGRIGSKVFVVLCAHDTFYVIIYQTTFYLFSFTNLDTNHSDTCSLS